MTDVSTHFIITRDNINMEEHLWVTTEDSCVLHHRRVTKCAYTGRVTRSKWHRKIFYHVDESESGYDVAVIAAARVIDLCVEDGIAIQHL